MSVSFGPILLHTALLASHISCDDDIEKIYLHKSRFYELMRLSMRLIDDIHDFEVLILFPFSTDIKCINKIYGT